MQFFDQEICVDALHAKKVSNTILEIGIVEAWRRCNPSLSQFIPTKCNIYDLFALSNRENETIVEYDLLYIGSSQDVYRRLSNHKTILKIHRDVATYCPDKEIFVWILKPKAKFYKQMINNPDSSMLFSGLDWPRDNILGINVKPEDIFLIAEAMLINYFKPPYNRQYVKGFPKATHSVYKKLYDEGVENVQVDLNLFMQEFKNILSIRTETKNTNNTKHMMLYAPLKNLKDNSCDNIIFADDLPEDLYDLFIGS